MSAILSADDLNDFISPGVACIKPVESLGITSVTQTSNPYEVTTEDKAPPTNSSPAQISLTDCLACSGCVTSAEAVLISLQSHSEVLHTLDTHSSLSPADLGQDDGESKVFVASVSPQVRASLAATYNITSQEAGHMLAQFLSGPLGLRSGGARSSGFTWVVDTNVAREATLVLGTQEILSTTNDTTHGPILASSCPGWICYAEKTHPHVLPHLSCMKSPQALLGTLLKTSLSKRLKIAPSRIWHLAVMPCFDKKLEASRSELTAAAWMSDSSSYEKTEAQTRDVDCVITTREILLLAAARGIDLPSLPITPIIEIPFPDPTLSQFLFPLPTRPHQHALDPSRTGTSGGNVSYLLSTVLAQHPGSTLVTTPGRNSDVVEYSVLPAPDSDMARTIPIIKVARYYGFRNIQNLVRRLKPAKPSKFPGVAAARARRSKTGAGGGDAEPAYAYVEVMACPGGCTNGGGQVKANDTIVEGQTTGSAGRERDKEWLQKVDEAYFSSDEAAIVNGESEQEGKPEWETNTSSLEGDEIDGISPRRILRYMQYWAELTGLDLDRLVKTSYRAVESDVGKEQHVVEIASKAGGGW